MVDGAAAIPAEMIRLANPMTPDQACLRTALLGSLLRTVSANMRHETPRRICLSWAGSTCHRWTRCPVSGALWASR